MKRKLLSTLLAALLALPATAQLTGDGSITNPYSGSLAGNFTISGTKYFNGNIYVDNETLTVAAGATLIALQSRASIFVFNTGTIVASGTSSSPILFTTDLDQDGILGESTESWGNITISSSGTSSLTYCTFERGKKDHIKFGLLGGGLSLSSSSVTVTSCTFRYCNAANGGAIAVLAGKSPTITKCTFLSNATTGQGGAIYIENGSSPTISDCVFNGNSSTSATLQGGAIASLSSSPIIVNSTIVYSTATVSDGTSVYLENSSGAVLVNNVIWGGSNHIGLNGTLSSVLAYNAIEGATYANNITLSSTNTDSEGPNFISPTTGDFNISFTSPMRDSGTDSYTGVTIPATDMSGTTRIYITDIGAYEMIYSRWHGNFGTSWTLSRNWEGYYLPTSRNIVIPGGLTNYPTASPGPSFTLNSGLTMEIEPGAKATFSSLTNNGTIELRADASGMASLIAGSYSGSGGNLNAEVYLKGSTSTDIWHYIAAPATVSKTVFTDIEPDYLARYDESAVVSDLVEGWQWHDGYDGTTPFYYLEAKEGYDVLVDEDTVMVYRNLKSLTTSLGQFNLPFSGSGLDTALYGYSLLGNSLTCGINWDNVTVSDANVRDAYYLQTENGEASYVNGVGTNGATAHLPPLQGFFVRTRATGTYITIPDNAREHNSTARFKSSGQLPLLRLVLSSSSSQDEMVIRFNEEATSGFDMELDAGKILNPRVKTPKIFSVGGSERYSINSIPWPEEKTIIPLTLVIPETGTFKFKRTQIPSSGNYTYTLTDKLTGNSVDLLSFSEYTFSSAAGTISDRFILTITNTDKSKTDESQTESEEPSIHIYTSSGTVYVLPQGTEFDNTRCSVRIYDITGRVLFTDNDEILNSGELKEYNPSSAKGLLIVEVVTSTDRYLEKVFVTR